MNMGAVLVFPKISQSVWREGGRNSGGDAECVGTDTKLA